MLIRDASPAFLDEWARLRLALWPDATLDELRDEAARFFMGDARHLRHVLFAHADSRLVGFAELNIRAYAEGCVTDRVAYLEGWFVEPDYRRRGIGAALIAAAERWAQREGCTEFASDALADNVDSAAAHLALGFEEVEVIRCFRKDVATRT